MTKVKGISEVFTKSSRIPKMQDIAVVVQANHSCLTVMTAHAITEIPVLQVRQVQVLQI